MNLAPNVASETVLDRCRNLGDVKTLIRERLGLCFEDGGETQLRAALARRIAATAAVDLAGYLSRLAVEPGELSALASLLTINETYFDREPHQLRLLTERLLPRLLQRREAADPVRILSVGCSTGEEPYSIAMALRERWGALADRLFRIEACDLDEQALARARAALYRPLSFRAMSSERISRWFQSAQGQQRRLRDEIRRQVAFRLLNLADTCCPAALRGQDVIFYRNVSVYFDADMRADVQQRLRGLLRPEGYLIVGTAETLANDIGLLTLCEEDEVWYFAQGGVGNRYSARPVARSERPAGTGPNMSQPQLALQPQRYQRDPVKRPHASGKPHPLPSLATAKKVVPPSPHADARPPSVAISDAGGMAQAYRRALALAREERFEQALVQLCPLGALSLDADTPTPMGAEPLTLLALLLHERGDTAAARVAAERALVDDPWSAPALTLLGRLARLADEIDAAIGYGRKAVYAEPAHWPAHLLLAELYRGTGSLDLARRAYRTALRRLEDEAAAQHAGPLPPSVPIRDLRALCSARMAQLGAA